MPELPEAETIARGLNAAIAGLVVARVRVHRNEVVQPMTPTGFRRALSGRRIERVGRRAKWLAAELDSGQRWVTQLRMTGRFTWSPSAPFRREPHLSLSVQLEGSIDAGVLRFYDTRRFARTWVLDPDAWAAVDTQLGIEPLSRRFTPNRLSTILARSRAPIRNLLLDQRKVAGIGNIYASEACFLAGIDPRRPARSLSNTEIERLHSGIRSVMRSAISRRGTTLSDYRDVLGGRGDFQNRLEVYGRVGEPCHRCGTEIERIVLAGRSAFCCPACQS
ncbi:MAG: bifunctional DNA-formamidopyrimidine glycosylase/DNA-(apurinic or apyrimidinic site) lyase [Gemmatimonadales bacterium]|jgi:formamidopyrimidine-DNA glycosylase